MKIFTTLLITCLFVTPAFATWPKPPSSSSNSNSNSNKNYNTNSNKNYNTNSNKNYNHNTNQQAQAQAQAQAQKQEQSQNASAINNVNIDIAGAEAYAGVEGASLGTSSLFGGGRYGGGYGFPVDFWRPVMQPTPWNPPLAPIYPVEQVEQKRPTAEIYTPQPSFMFGGVRYIIMD